MPDLSTTKAAIKKVLGLLSDAVGLTDTQQLENKTLGNNTKIKTSTAASTTFADIRPSLTTVADATRRTQFRVYNKDDDANFECMELLGHGSVGYYINITKGGTGSLRDLRFNMDGLGGFRMDVAGGVHMGHIISVQDNKLWAYNPAATFGYITRTSAITANRDVTEPLLTANDIRVYEAHAQPLTNKTIAGASNTLTDTSNNIFTKGATLNRLYPAGIMRGSPTALITSTTGPAVNTLYAMAFEVPTATTFDQISAEVTTLGSGSNIRLGIYDDNAGYPGALRFDSANISSASTGHKTATITAGVQAFKPGLYWLAYENSATVPQIRCLPGTDGLAIIGYPAPPSTTIPGLCYTVAHTVGALPNPYTASAAIRNTVSAVGSPIPAVMLRAV